MVASDSKSLQGIGFLTVVQDDQHGWLGGYLVLNTSSRPLEFHCTAPVKPNRAQQILYGPTLAPYLCGEQIGLALAKKSNVEPAVIFTDVAAMMTLRPLIELPVAYVELDRHEVKSGADEPARIRRIDGPHDQPPQDRAMRLIHFQIADCPLSVGEAFADDQRKVAALLEHARRMSPDAKLVKLADRLHNLSEMHVWPGWKQERYANAAMELLEALHPAPDETLAEDVRQMAKKVLSSSSKDSPQR